MVVSESIIYGLQSTNFNSFVIKWVIFWKNQIDENYLFFCTKHNRLLHCQRFWGIEWIVLPRHLYDNKSKIICQPPNTLFLRLYGSKSFCLVFQLREITLPIRQ
ncbi:hypothetical protein NIES806_13970 [Dolichospermum compactum NIES-806]|uniref:Uncharacterized protein n=1 Tax=Dolichospermum compactum NIES-806 TaxID=1973481 RepID=A0A1Z4V141_9CYAN|nr:hypothetical protein NIES806_13970 [Dolichospermum compactum NIES-806]